MIRIYGWTGDENDAFNIVRIRCLSTVWPDDGTLSAFAANMYHNNKWPGRGAMHREMNTIPLVPLGIRPTHNKVITVLLSSQKISRAVLTSNQYMGAFQSRSPFNLPEINNRKLKWWVLFTRKALISKNRLPNLLFLFDCLCSRSMLTAHTVPASSASHASLLKMVYNGF